MFWLAQHNLVSGLLNLLIEYLFLPCFRSGSYSMEFGGTDRGSGTVFGVSSVTLVSLRIFALSLVYKHGI